VVSLVDVVARLLERDVLLAAEDVEAADGGVPVLAAADEGAQPARMKA
jgi:hypothetical protein